MTKFRNVKFSTSDGVARFVLSRPPLNVLNISMLSELNRALESLADAPDIKVLVFSSDQKAFSAGVDIGDHTEEKVFTMLDEFHGVFRTLLELSIPTIAAVNGMALGGGCELASFCDFVIAAENAVFGQPEIKIGAFPPLAATYFPRLMGARLTAELLLLGDNLDARRAQQYGLVNKVVPEADLAKEVESLVKKLCAVSGSVLRVATRALRIGISASLQDTLEKIESVYFDDLMALEDAREGIQAFMERRKPEWKNR
ncbi:MAG TPA: enoyl-CoA hydratase-related protein [Acidobacteriota bacterium]|jgi:cyclohexa-1,5-dienecarbonyl-CoA hydratase|nr:enoyl-CoA hydratase-related protein [Acidobacteriota bacterium]